MGKEYFVRVRIPKQLRNIWGAIWRVRISFHAITLHLAQASRQQEHQIAPYASMRLSQTLES
jgi:hypothetical protein